MSRRVLQCPHFFQELFSKSEGACWTVGRTTPQAGHDALDETKGGVGEEHLRSVL